MPELVADRFFLSGRSWIDLATGAPVRLRVARAGTIVEQIEWSARCATLANLRHPLLNVLVDYGTLDRERTFEAYECGEAVTASGTPGERLLTHAARFLEANGLILAAPQTTCAVRAVTIGGAGRGRPVGLVLQPRVALRAIADALDSPSPPGPSHVVVGGATGTGLRTLRVAVARIARLAGYVPVAGWLPEIYPWLAGELAERHVCVLQLEGQGRRAAAVGFVADLACRSARRHAVVSFVRNAPSSGSVRLEPLGVTAMTRMVFVDAEHGPDPTELLAAVRRAAGCPGTLVTELGGCAFHEPHRLLRVRETAPAYVVFPGTADAARRPRGRTAGVLFRAATRAHALAAKGRHAAAMRVLARASRALEGRGELAEASRCAIRLGELKLVRGRAADALACFDRARSLSRDEALHAQAAVGTGMARLAEGRLADAEAALRGALMAGGAAASRASAVLIRVLLQQQRIDEASVVLDASQRGERRCRDLDLAAAELHLASGNLPDAVRSSLAVVEDAHASGDAVEVARAERVCALALAAAGNPRAALEHAREGLAGARRAHVPLEAARLREVLQRLTAGAAAPPVARAASSAADLEVFLELAHGAEHERAAIQRVCEELRARLRAATVLVTTSGPPSRMLVTYGRPWVGQPIVADRAVAAGGGVAPGRGEPAEAAEPIRIAGEVIGALAVRWAAGTDVLPERATAMLRAAAVALAPFVSALDDGPAAPAAQGAHALLGESAEAQALRHAMACAARAPFAVLIEGESGSGKELVARGVHAWSPRRERRFCTLNCAALTDELVEAELFGHTRGAFTGAVGERAGLFEEADGGSLFLDEVGELSPRAQAKLLRVLQDGEVRRVGENVARHVDVRVIAATNRSLEREVTAGRFRADLRFRLDVVRLVVPPLRERAIDVPLLASHFWTAAAARVGSRATLSPDTLRLLAQYDWPGNVRELQNVIAWMAVHSPRRGRVDPAALPAHVARAGVPAAATFQAARDEFERRYIRTALACADGQRGRAAEALGLTRQGLAKMMKRLGIANP